MGYSSSAVATEKTGEQEQHSFLIPGPLYPGFSNVPYFQHIFLVKEIQLLYICQHKNLEKAATSVV